ncbi:uncharacterized protein LOC21395713 isoform X1 [Morus notabilis]|uniref:uncharacterized protein LOC21395713 isoform X1 n=1 Tax=Morus notabilis TaxID=981085 RepID=UPI000CED4A79|nr:uncharacterized protein LOC21395713 isoform X1 [Morus notabilis]
MESDTRDGGITGTAATWSSATNWTAVHGTLVNTITFDSSLSPIDGHDETIDLNSVANRPLILRPYALDAGPCEITVTFTQKHEVQQIYVKSTARVYEIYYESDLQSGKEYLCTVRCGIAARDVDSEEALSPNLKGAHDNPLQENLRNDGNRTSSEDEWVDVRVPDGKKDNSLPLMTQDYYEATAQISDAHPCRSLTIRLLSVQSKDSVYIDEVYVFADPVDSTDSENQANKMENSSGNPLMAMLLPTLLQMSKTKGISAIRTQDKHTSEASRTQNFIESTSEATCSTNCATKIQQERNSSIAHHGKMELQDVNTAGTNASQLQRPPQVSLGESKADSLPPNDRVERALDQLFSRMGRIEDLFLRFEDNLLKPISSIEARLLRVEQQLEVLTNKQKDCEPRLYSRFCAPNFSSVQSDSNSFYHSETDYPRCEEFGSNIKSFHYDAQTMNTQTNQADDVSDSVNTTQLLPSLVVTAPEFLNFDDEEENQESDRITESSADKPRNAITVDDALASALAGFVSSISSQPQNHIPSLSVKAPEFSNEEEDTEVGAEASPRDQHEIRTDGAENINGSLSHASCPSLDGKKKVEKSLNDDQSEETAEEVKAPEFSNEEEDTEVGAEASPRDQHEIRTDGAENINGSLSHASCLSLDGKKKVEKSLNDDPSEATAEEVGGRYQQFEGGEDDQPSGRPINKNDEQADDDKAGAQNFERAVEIEGAEVSTEANSGLVHNKTDVQYQWFLNQTDATGSHTTKNDATSIADSITEAENTKAESDNKDQGILRNILESSCTTASVVDFESPVLDVKFISQSSHSSNFTLEALLSDSPESKFEGATCAEESHSTTPSDEHGDLISVEDGEEPLGLVTNNQIYVDFDYCSLPQEHWSGEGETPMASSSISSCSHETFPTSLI